jgi:hypothetical protein
MDERQLTSLTNTQSTTATEPPTLTDGMYLTRRDFGNADRLSLQL